MKNTRFSVFINSLFTFGRGNVLGIVGDVLDSGAMFWVGGSGMFWVGGDVWVG